MRRHKRVPFPIILEQTLIPPGQQRLSKGLRPSPPPRSLQLPPRQLAGVVAMAVSRLLLNYMLSYVCMDR